MALLSKTCLPHVAAGKRLAIRTCILRPIEPQLHLPQMCSPDSDAESVASKLS